MLKYTGLAGCLSLMFLVGCDLDAVSTGPIQTETRSIERDKSELVRAEVRLGAGELHVRGGAQKMVEADFRYNVPEWKPEIRYNATGFRRILSIGQPGSRKISGHTTYDWNLRFNDDTPLDMIVHMGAGQAQLDLGSLSLRSVEVNIGVGEVKMDLRGTPAHDYDVRVHGGVGEASIQLPRGVGVMADAHGGIGEINAHGMRKRGSHYVNDAYDNAKVILHVDVKGGIGTINLYAN
jgi:hypothetical protein